MGEGRNHARKREISGGGDADRGGEIIPTRSLPSAARDLPHRGGGEPLGFDSVGHRANFGSRVNRLRFVSSLTRLIYHRVSPPNGGVGHTAGGRNGVWERRSRPCRGHGDVVALRGRAAPVVRGGG